MARREYTLRAPLHPTEDKEWTFAVPGLENQRGKGKHISFTAASMKLRFEPIPSNRIIHNDDPQRFIVVSFAELRFPEPATLGTTKDYIRRFFDKGLTLNGTHYRFYGHSNSQLRGRSCFMREARTDAELDSRIYALGSFQSIMNVAKRTCNADVADLFADVGIGRRGQTDWLALLWSGDRLPVGSDAHARYRRYQDGRRAFL